MRISESLFIIFKCRSGRSVGIAIEAAMRAAVICADVFRENAAARLALAAVGLGVIKEVLQNGIIGCKTADQLRVDAAIVLYSIFPKINRFGARRQPEIPIVTV